MAILDLHAEDEAELVLEAHERVDGDVVGIGNGRLAHPVRTGQHRLRVVVRDHRIHDRVALLRVGSRGLAELDDAHRITRVHLEGFLHVLIVVHALHEVARRAQQLVVRERLVEVVGALERDLVARADGDARVGQHVEHRGALARERAYAGHAALRAAVLEAVALVVLQVVGRDRLGGGHVARGVGLLERERVGVQNARGDGAFHVGETVGRDGDLVALGTRPPVVAVGNGAVDLVARLGVDDRRIARAVEDQRVDGVAPSILVRIEGILVCGQLLRRLLLAVGADRGHGDFGHLVGPCLIVLVDGDLGIATVAIGGAQVDLLIGGDGGRLDPLRIQLDVARDLAGLLEVERFGQVLVGVPSGKGIAVALGIGRLLQAVLDLAFGYGLVGALGHRDALDPVLGVDRGVLVGQDGIALDRLGIDVEALDARVEGNRMLVINADAEDEAELVLEAHELVALGVGGRGDVRLAHPIRAGQHRLGVVVRDHGLHSGIALKRCLSSDLAEVERGGICLSLARRRHLHVGVLDVLVIVHALDEVAVHAQQLVVRERLVEVVGALERDLVARFDGDARVGQHVEHGRAVARERANAGHAALRAAVLEAVGIVLLEIGGRDRLGRGHVARGVGLLEREGVGVQRAERHVRLGILIAFGRDRHPVLLGVGVDGVAPTAGNAHTLAVDRVAGLRVDDGVLARALDDEHAVLDVHRVLIGRQLDRGLVLAVVADGDDDDLGHLVGPCGRGVVEVDLDVAAVAVGGAQADLLIGDDGGSLGGLRLGLRSLGAALAHADGIGDGSTRPVLEARGHGDGAFAVGLALDRDGAGVGRSDIGLRDVLAGDDVGYRRDVLL